MHLTTSGNQNLAGHARDSRDPQGQLADRSAGYQCHSIFIQPDELYGLT
jgi:hypothetical protein